jgi:hypothetical protein
MPITNQIIRISADSASKENVIDINSNAEPEAWVSNDLTIQFGWFLNGVLQSVAGISSVTFYLKDNTDLDGPSLLDLTVNSFDNTTTQNTWAAGTQQQGVIAITADDLALGGLQGNPPSRLLHFSLVAVMGTGQITTLCVGTLNLIDPGANSGGSVPAAALTGSQVAALIAAAAISPAALNLNAAGTSAITNANPWIAGRQPVTLAAGGGAYVANLTLTDVVAVTSTPLAGAVLRVIVDFPASANPTLNIYDSSVAGTLLQGPLTNPNPAIAQSFYFQAGFDGANWHKEDGHWI